MTQLIISTVLLCIIICFEMWRRMTNQPLGLLSVANMVFALGYCISPLFISLVGGTSLEVSPYGTVERDMRLYIFPLLEHLGLENGAYTKAALFAVLAYVSMLAGYVLAWRKGENRLPPLDGKQLSSMHLAVVGSALGAVAVVALFLFSSQFFEHAALIPNDPNIELYLSDPTGVGLMMKLGPHVRGGIISVSRGYLQIVILLGVPAIIFLSAAALKTNGPMRWLLVAMVLTVWLAVFSRMVYAAGRMEFAMFMALFPLAGIFMLRSRLAISAVVIPLFLFGLFIGVLGKTLFIFPAERLAAMGDVLFLQTGQSLLFVLNEFSFPHVISANTISVTSAAVGYRYFIDIPLAALYMLPSIGGVDTWPPMISHIHEGFLPEIPFDMVSFGYYSLGPLGVVAVFSVLGGGMALLDRWLAPGAGWLAQCLRAAWMMYLPFRIMYADPYTSMKTGFGLIIGTVLVLVLVWLAQRQSNVSKERV